MVSPLRLGTGTPSDWFFVDKESCSGEAESLSLFLGFLGFIGFFSIGITRNGAMWAPQANKPRSPPPGSRPDGLCPTGGSPLVVLHSNIAYFLQKKSSKSFGRFRELSFSAQKQHHGNSAKNNVSAGDTSPTYL